MHKGCFPLEVKGKALTWWCQHALINKTINSSLLSITSQSVPPPVELAKTCPSIPLLLTHIDFTHNRPVHIYIIVFMQHCTNHRNIRPINVMHAKSCLHMRAKRQFNRTLFTFCPPYVMILSVWNLRSFTEGGPVAPRTPNTLRAPGPVRRKRAQLD